MSPRLHLVGVLALALAPLAFADDGVPLPAPSAGARVVERVNPRDTPEHLRVASPLGATSSARVSTAPPPAVAPAPLPRPRVRWAIATGFDYGFNELVSVSMEGGGSQSISANEGLFLSLGATFLPLLEGRLETQATVGVKGWSIDASNGSLSVTMFPIELLETFSAHPLRLSAGLVYVPGPSTKASGLLAELDGIDFDNSLGLVLQGEWLKPFTNGRGQLSLGPRFVLQKFQIAHGGAVLSANALGFVASVAFR